MIPARLTRRNRLDGIVGSRHPIACNPRHALRLTRRSTRLDSTERLAACNETGAHRRNL